MHDNKIHTIYLGTTTANSDLSAWAELLEPLGFVSSSDVSMLYYKDTGVRLHCSGSALGLDCNNVSVGNIAVNINTNNQKITYRYINNGDDILFGVSSAAATTPLSSSIISPKKEGDKWFFQLNGMWGIVQQGFTNAPNINAYSFQMAAQHNSSIYFPTDTYAVIKHWQVEHFRDDIYECILRPNLGGNTGTITKVNIGDKTYLLQNNTDATRCCFAYDITNETEGENTPDVENQI